MTHEQTYTYYAFVSYSHKDEKWGRWIQGALESYRLPAAVRKEVGKPLPQRIHPVFRDDTDLGAGRLADNLRQELEQSRYLIVVCSPNSAKPNAEGKHWVNEEVTRFCEMGRADHVIPVIVEGTAETSFCPKIVEEGLLGLDATRHSRARILNDLVAKILGLRPDELWRREERRLRAKRRWRILAASLAASFVALGGYIAWDCTRTVTNYYADYVDSFGLPKGIVQLTAEKVARRHFHYRFEFKGYRLGKSIHADSARPSLLQAFGFQRILRKVIQSNSFGVPVEVTHKEWKQRPVILDCSKKTDYRLDGALERIRTQSFGDNTEQVKRFEEKNGCQNAICYLENRGDASFSFFSGAMTRNAQQFEPTPGISAVSVTRIAKVKILRDTFGHEIGYRFQDSEGRPTPDIDGIFGFDMTVDKDGRVIEERYLSHKEDGEYYIRENRIGVAIKRFTYLGDTLARVGFFNSAGESVRDEEGVSSYQYKFDEDGNVIAETHLDENGRSSPNRHGIASICFAYDERGNLFSLQYFDATGNRTRDIHGIAEAKIQSDNMGLDLKWSYFDENGKPTKTEQGFSVICLHKDENGRITHMSSFDEEGKPMPGNEGQYAIANKYDSEGHRVKITYLNQKGTPMNGAEGFATMVLDYDELGNLSETSLFDSEGKPTVNKDGVHHVRFDWDKYGLGQTGHAFFDTNDLPTISREGWHRVVYETRRGRIASETYLSTNLTQTLNISGFSRVTHKFDRMGNVTNEIYWAPNGSMTCHKAGPAGWEAEYDDYGNGVLIRCFDPTGKSTDNGQGVAIVRRKYDRKGLMTDELGFDEDGRPCKNIAGFSWRHVEYDSYGRQTRETLYDENNEPVCAMGEACQVWNEYDGRGRIVSKRWTDINGALAINQDGIAEIRFKFDAWGRVVDTLYLDNVEKPVSGTDGAPEMTFRLDPAGRIVKKDYRNGHGVRISNAAGIACEEMEWDIHGNNTKKVFLGSTGGKVFCPEGYAEIHVKHDSRGNPIQAIYFAPNGERINGPYCVGEVRSSYDVRGNQIWQGFFDFDGKPMDGSVGFSVFNCEYDAGNRPIRRVLFGATPLSEAILYPSKERRYKYDDKGHLVKEQIFSAAGMLSRGFDGWAERRIDYSTSGQPIRETFFDENGKRTSVIDGTSEIVMEYWGGGFGHIKTVERRAEPGTNGLFRLANLATYRESYSLSGKQRDFQWIKSDGTSFEEWPDTTVLFVQYVVPGSQAERAGIRSGDMFYACCAKDLHMAVPLLFTSSLKNQDYTQARDQFFEMIVPLLVAKDTTIIFARHEGGAHRFFEATFPDGNAIDINHEIGYSVSSIPFVTAFQLTQAYKIITPSVVLCIEVLPGSTAEKAGVHAGDIILRYCDYVLSPSSRVQHFFQEVQKMTNQEKTLVTLRKDDGKWSRHSFTLPAGIMGIKHVDATVQRSVLDILYSQTSQLVKQK